MMRNAIGWLTWLIPLVCGLTSSVQAATLDVGSGKPYTSIQTAINAAASGDTVLVYSGTYSENINYNAKNLVLQSVSGAASTTITGTSTTVSLVGGETSSAILDGFTVKNTSGTGTLLTLTNSSPQIKNCTFRDLSASTSRGVNATNSNASFTSVTFDNNAFSGAGYNFLMSGTSNISISGSTFNNCRSYHGGAIYQDSGTTLTITNTTLSNNRGVYTYAHGGAIYSVGTRLSMTGCTFQANNSYHGAAISTTSGSLRMVVRNSKFYGNGTATYGGVAYHTASPQMHYIDNIFQENYATYGGAFYLDGGNNTSFINNTFVGNKGNSTAGHIYAAASSSTLLLQNILSNAQNGVALYTADISARVSTWYNDFYSNTSGNLGGSYTAYIIGYRGNITDNPLYTTYLLDGNFTNDNLTLQSTSTVRNVGDPEFLDSDGSRADLGAGGGDDDRIVSGATHTVSPLDSSTYKTISSAISAASSGAIIYVYPGIYYEAVTYGGKNLEVRGIYGPETVVIAGNGTAVSMTGGETSSAILDGATLWGTGYYPAIRTSSSSPIFRNVDVRYNLYYASNTFAIYNTSGAPTFDTVRVEYNQGANVYYTHLIDGSGTVTIANSTYTANYGYHGGAIYHGGTSTLNITNTTLTSNVGTYTYSHGGAIYTIGNRLSISGCTFRYNYGYHGAVISSTASTTRILVRNSFFQGNGTSTYGGVAYHTASVQIHYIDNVFQENIATNGGAFYMDGGAQSSFINNTFVGNKANTTAGALYLAPNSSTLVLQNIFAYMQKGGAIYTADITARQLSWYNDFYSNTGGDYTGTYTANMVGYRGNKSDNPQFNNYTLDGNHTNDDLTLSSSSTLHDAGDPDFKDTDGSAGALGYGGSDDDAVVSGGDFIVSPLDSATYRTISSAVAVSSSGQVIHVYPGIYYEAVSYGGRNIQIKGVYGPETVLVAGIGTAVSLTSSESSAARLEGVTLWGTGLYPALRTSGSSPMIRNVDVRYNIYSSSNTFAVYNSGGQPSFDTVRMEDNKGSGVYYTHLLDSSSVATIQSSTYSRNYGYHGGAIYVGGGVNLTIKTTTFTSNVGTYTYAHGGAIYMTGSRLSVDDSILEYNNAYHGSALSSTTSGQLLFRDTIFRGNGTSTYGGVGYLTASAQTNFIDCIFQENYATYGGAFYLDGGQNTGFINNTFVGNKGNSTGGHIYAAANSSSMFLQNILAYSQTTSAVYTTDVSARTLFWYNDFYGNASTNLSGTYTNYILGYRGNRTEDPRFTAYSVDGNHSNDNLTLRSDSTLLDAGDPDFKDTDATAAKLGAGGGDDDALVSGADLTVSPLDSSSYKSVNAAIAAATSGKKIYVYPGVYYEAVSYSGKNVHVKGIYGAETVLLAGNGTSVSITSGETSSAILEGVTLWGTGYYPALRTNGTSPQINNVDVRYNLYYAANTFAIYNSAGAPTFSGCRIEDNQGANVYYTHLLDGAGIVTITSATYSRNYGYHGGAIYGGGTTKITIRDSSFVSNVGTYSYAHGGAIYDVGTRLSIKNTLFQYNYAYHGAAISTTASTTRVLVRNSTFQGNQTATYGGVAYHTANAQIHYIDNIFQENKASYGGAFYLDGGAQTSYINNTFVGNRGNSTAGHLYLAANSNTLLLQNIFAHSAVGSAVYTTDGSARVLAWYNDFYSNAGGNFTGTYTANMTGYRGNLTVDPKFISYDLDAVFGDDNLTLASDSSLINAGDPEFLDTDNTTADLGVNGGDDDALVSGADYTVGPLDEHPYQSITSALSVAQSGDTIFVYPGTYFEAVVYNTKTVEIKGVYGPETVLIAGNGTAVSMVNSESSGAILDGVTLWGTGLYPALRTTNSSPTLRNIDVRYNYYYTSNTFAVYNYGGSPSFTNLRVEDNKGANVYYTHLVDASATSITNGTYSRNYGYHGGALYCGSNSNVTIKDSGFYSNTGTYIYSHGGAIYGAGSRIEIRNSIFQYNYAYHGAAISTTSGLRMVVRDSRFQGNGTSTYGGVAYHTASPQTHYIDNTFQENYATYGGAFYLDGGQNTSFVNNNFVGNKGNSTAGHLYLAANSSTLLLQNILSHAQAGAALYTSDVSARVNTWYNDFYNPSSSNFGGAYTAYILNYRGNVSVDPLFTSLTVDGNFTNDNFTLQSSSTMKNAGDPEFLDSDGTTADLGVGGGNDDRVTTGANFVVCPFDLDSSVYATTYRSIGSAISAASSGHIIHVYPGVYFEAVSYGGKNVQIKGLYGAETVLIPGNGTAVSMTTGESSSAVLEGVTLWGTGYYPALYTSGSSPTIKNVDVRYNLYYASNTFAIYNLNGAPTMSGLRVEDNRGANVYYTHLISGVNGASISSSSYNRNYGYHGGALYVSSSGYLSISGSSFSGNTGTYTYSHGGAMYVSSSNVLIRSSTFTYNYAYHGGVMSLNMANNTNVVTTRDSTLFANSATYGGSIYSVSGHAYFLDSYLVENSGTYGGAAYLDSTSRNSFINCNVIGNTSSSSNGSLSFAGTSDSLVVNSIVGYAAAGYGIYTDGTPARVLVSYTDTYSNATGNYGGSIGNQASDHGNQAVDPKFIAYSRDGNLGNDNFKFQSGSTMVDKGLSAFLDKDGTVSNLGVGGGDDDKKATTYDYYVSPLFDTAYRSVAAAVAAAATGKKVAIYPGLYYSDIDPNGKTITLQGVYGQLGTAIAGSSQALTLDQGEGTSSSPMLVKGLSFTTAGNYAVRLQSSYLRLEDSAVRYSYGTYGVYATGGSLSLSRTTVENNIPTNGYSCLVTGSMSVTITGSSFLNNRSYHGGGLYISAGASTIISSSRFAYNQATYVYGHGGAIYASGSGVSISSTSFVGNYAYHGSAMSMSGVTGGFSGNTFISNGTSTYGGVYYSAGSTTTWLNNIFQGNVATYGGMAYLDGGENANFTNNNFIQNKGNSVGGNVYTASGSRFTCNNNIIGYTDAGVGLYIASGTTSYSITYSDFYGNTYGNVGGIISSVPATNNYTSDPTFVNYTRDTNHSNDDQHLKTSPASPLIDVGDPAIFDTDGTRSDVGVYGGAGIGEYDKDLDGYLTSEGDCDDLNASSFPGATEIKDGKDNDCDGEIDEIFTDIDEDGYDPTAGDCDETNPNVNPGEAEVCDGLDQDCDDLIDEGVLVTYYLDTDGDGYGVSSYTTQACSRPSGYANSSGDCDDSRNDVYPGRAESCDGRDNDCDSVIDEGVKPTWYYDNDHDNYGKSTTSTQSCTQPSGYVSTSTDCNDNNSGINPAATEVCDGIDQDCDGTIDDGVGVTHYADSDGDTYGNNSSATFGCSIPSGRVTVGNDCNDSNASSYPGATELCDLQDNDCDSVIDEGVLLTYYSDTDLDGYGLNSSAGQGCSVPSGKVTAGGDCNDGNATVHPGAAELCDSIDNDCDGYTDEGIALTYYYDSDGDQFGRSSGSVVACSQPSGYVTGGGDCNDSNSAIYPGATETCNGVDDDCDGVKDDGLTFVTYYRDDDGDAYGQYSYRQTICSGQPSGYATAYGDCNESNADINPGEIEVCDGIDNNCANGVDEGYDLDGDGHPVCEIAGEPLDCDDNDETVYPEATELCDLKDNDCDGVADEPEDNDGDGYIGCDNGVTVDCNDYEENSFPDNLEVCDQIDNDCNGLTDEGFDLDVDGYYQCDHGLLSSDCDDLDPTINPGAIEVCDTIDNDCDGNVDDVYTYCTDSDGDGFGAPGTEVNACTEPTENSVQNCTDFNDNNSYIYPNAPEGQGDSNGNYVIDGDGVDNDGDGIIDEGTDAYDDDGDGYTENGGDCNDSNYYAHPGATEYADGVDNDCDGEVDDDLDYTDDDLDGYSENEGDCDDGQPTVYVGGTEVPDELDNDCDGLVDEGTIFGDDDNDGYSEAEGDCDDSEVYTYPGAPEFYDGDDNDCNGFVDDDLDVEDDDDDGYSEAEGDCNDADPFVYPLAIEMADGIDNDCDGIVDDGTGGTDPDNDNIHNVLDNCPDDYNPTQSDHDDDGIGDACDPDADADGYSEDAGDCNDLDGGINPGGLEVCDSVDNDCDGQTDEGLTSTYCEDQDHDGYGDPETAFQACFQLEGTVINCTDLNDNNGNTYPGAPEIEDGIDNDGDGFVDEGTDSADDDGDGFSENESDCDDTNPYSYPGAPEYSDGQDNDCDGDADDGIDTNDDDNDQYSEADGDCDDSDGDNHPLNNEIPDGEDNDCDGNVDEGTNAGDDDGDGYSEIDGDCDDSEVYTHPNAPEFYDGDDNDCDGLVDEDADTTDDDGDGYSEAEGDCDDLNPNYSPGEEEVLDDQDNDCDGLVDEGLDGTDNDADGVLNSQDNCPDDANPDQTDSDNDDVGDFCDPDDDNDGTLDGEDECPRDPLNDEDDDGICGDEDSCYDGGGDDLDGDGVCEGDNCPYLFNPDQVDQEEDGIGDPCDYAPATSDSNNLTYSMTDKAIVLSPVESVYLYTPDYRAYTTIGGGLVSEFYTLSIVKTESNASDFWVRANVGTEAEPVDKVFMQYEFQIGGQDGRAFAGGSAVIVCFTLDAHEFEVSRAFRNRSLAVWENADTDGDGEDDQLMEIPNCESGRMTADERCSYAYGSDTDGNGSFDEITVDAPVRRF